MSIWDNISKAILHPIDTLEGSASRIWHGITGTPTEDEKRNQRYAINDQIKAYKDATELTQQQLAQTQAEKAVEKRKINEKQIRALRNNFRPAGGFLGNQAASLGSSNELTNKLGT